MVVKCNGFLERSVGFFFNTWTFGDKKEPLLSLFQMPIRITSDKKPVVMYIPVTKHLPSKISSNCCRELTDVLSTVFPKELPFIWVILVTAYCACA